MNERQREDLHWELFGNTSALRVTFVQLRRHAIALGLACSLAVAIYATNVFVGWRAESVVNGTISIPSLHDRVVIRRDARGVPHVAASNELDLFFSQGFAEGSDRLFEMDLTRRYAFGELAEVLGPKALPMDESQRYYDVHDIVDRQWSRLAPRERGILEAFSAGINAAMTTQPLPVEFRMLLYRPKPWTPRDSLAVSLAVSIALADSWRDVLSRNDTWQRVGPQKFDDYIPLSDPNYDVSLDGRSVQHLATSFVAFDQPAPSHAQASPRAGSNAWAVGATHSATRRALLANDPHLDLTIPGLWYLLDLKAPGFHAAGASIPGVPGVLLGHNERIAWGATNSDASSMSLFYAGRLARSNWKREIIHVRFSKDASLQYYRTAHEFGVPSWDSRRLALVRWPAYDREQPAITTFLQLDRARSTREALAILSHYTGTSENFVIAENRGDVAYHLAGGIVNDPAWERYVHPARDIAADYRSIPFGRLPSVSPSRDSVIVSANNKMYASGYPYRLAATFDAPYRAYRIAQLLREQRTYDVSYFSSMQLDTVSPVDLEFARAVARYSGEHFVGLAYDVGRELAAWDGSYAQASHAASVEHAVRASMDGASLFAVMQELRHGDASPEFEGNLRAALFYAGGTTQPWAQAGAVPVEHPLAPLPFGFLNGTTLPGDGDEYTIHLQEDGFAQSFRAVWDVGNWDAGGISIPSGESGEPGSGHYTDLTSAWIEGKLEPLPFSDAAVGAATQEQLTLVP